MRRVEVAHTADVSKDALARARALIFDVFGDATEDDWEHCLGGMHAIAWENDELVGHGSVVLRRLIYKERGLRTGYVEGVAVRRDRHRQGIGSAIMAELERIIKGAYELGGLGSSEEGLPFYVARGWLRWKGKSYAMTPTGVVRTAEDDDGIFVLPVSVEVDLGDDLICDYREGSGW